MTVKVALLRTIRVVGVAFGGAALMCTLNGYVAWSHADVPTTALLAGLATTFTLGFVEASWLALQVSRRLAS